jgi:hypothetical protein
MLAVAHHLVEGAACPHALRRADEDDRNLDAHLLPGDELLEVHMQYVTLDGVPLDLADQRPGGPAVHG